MLEQLCICPLERAWPPLGRPVVPLECRINAASSAVLTHRNLMAALLQHESGDLSRPDDVLLALSRCLTS
jgi:hypothetical protein